MSSEYDLIPELTLAALKRYENGIWPGDFLCSVLSNNLFAAVDYADEPNQLALVQIVKYIFNKMPGICHGSPEKVKDWLCRDSETRLERIG